MHKKSALPLIALLLLISPLALADRVFYLKDLERMEAQAAENTAIAQEHHAHLLTTLNEQDKETKELFAYLNQLNRNSPEFETTQRHLREVLNKQSADLEIGAQLLRVNHEAMDSFAALVGIAKAANQHCQLSSDENLFATLEQMNYILNTKLTLDAYNPGYNLPHIANNAYAAHQHARFENKLCEALPERNERYAAAAAIYKQRVAELAAAED